MRFLNIDNKIRAESIKKVLLVKLSHLGDVIMSTAVFKEVREIFPEAKISLLIKKEYISLLETNKDIDEVIGFDAPWNTKKSNWLRIYSLCKRYLSLKQKKFDIAIDLEDDKKSNIFIYLLGIRYRIGFGYKGSARYLTNYFVSNFKKEHRIERMGQLINSVRALVGKSLPESKKVFYQNPQIIIRGKDLGYADKELEALNFSNSILIAVHAWSGAIYKNFPVNLYKKIIISLLSEIKNLKVLLIVGPNDQATSKLYIPDYSDRIIKIETNLKQVSALLSRCSLYVGGDTGISHLAAALNIPTICLFGASIYSVWRPVGKEVHVVESDLKCSPCVFPGELFRCKEMKCLHSLDCEKIATLALTILKKNDRANYEKKKTTKTFS